MSLSRGVRPSLVPATWTTAALAVGTFYVAYDDGSYSLAARSTIAIVVWWTIMAGFALGVWPRERVPRGAIATGVLLALFAGWTLASAAWSASSEQVVDEFDRVALYLGVFALVVLAGRRVDFDRWLSGLTFTIVAIGIVALVSRLFPGSFPSRGLPAELPSSSTRLSFPLDYWNGLGIFVAMAVPLILLRALAGGRLWRALAVAALPALGAVVYLTSSRGAAVAAAVGASVFVVLQPRRWAALGLAAAGALGGAAAVVVLAPRHSLVDGPLAGAQAQTEGRSAAALLLLVCAGTALLVEVGAAVAARRPPPPARLRRLVVALVGALVLAGIGYETRSLRDFTRVPDVSASTTTSAHLLSGAGSGRWQFWKAALDEFESSPLYGRGAGSFADWWAQHASFPYVVQDAHSLFFQTLGELGIVGLLLLAGALGCAVAVGADGLRRAAGRDRAPPAALFGAFTAYAIGAAVDWMWELTAVTIVGIVVLALLVGPTDRTDASMQRPRRRSGRAAAIVLASAAILVLQAIPLLADVEVGRSQADARAGRLAAARTHALAATRIAPWAASTHLQLALVEENAGSLIAARRAAAEAIRRDRDDWRPWYVAAQIEARLHDGAAARRDRARAAALDQESPFFASG